MRRLDLTLPSAAENVALDEGLLDWAEVENPEWEFLRLWESRQPLVVVGRSSRVHQEVNVSACGERDIPILRRSSGGAAIVAGLGCLMYALVLSYKLRPDLKDIRRAHACVLGKLAESLGPILADRGTVMHVGTSDLALVEPSAAVSRKFSGNSLRARRSHLLYHGTLLYDFDLRLIETCLQMPPRQPEYRERRSHIEFVTNLPATRQQLADAVDNAWPCTQELTDWPATRVADLVAARFGDDRWTFEFR
jgi:lipoate-protein ligase A